MSKLETKNQKIEALYLELTSDEKREFHNFLLEFQKKERMEELKKTKDEFVDKFDEAGRLAMESLSKIFRF